MAEIGGTWTGADTTAVTIDGWTTSNENYIKIYTTGDARHSGFWNEAAYRQRSQMLLILRIRTKYNNRWLQFKQTLNNQLNKYGAIYCSFLNIPNVYLIISNNLVRGVMSGTTNSSRGICVEYMTGVAIIYNNCVWDYINEANDCVGFRIGSAGTISTSGYYYNNTAVNCYRGYSRGGGKFSAVNCLAQNCNDGFYDITTANSRNNLSDIQ